MGRMNRQRGSSVLNILLGVICGFFLLVFFTAINPDADEMGTSWIGWMIMIPLLVIPAAILYKMLRWFKNRTGMRHYEDGVAGIPNTVALDRIYGLFVADEEAHYSLQLCIGQEALRSAVGRELFTVYVPSDSEEHEAVCSAVDNLFERGIIHFEDGWLELGVGVSGIQKIINRRRAYTK